jgi:hypothetical protein
MPKKKGLGTRVQIKSEKERERRIATAVFLIIILFSAAFSVYFGCTILSPSSDLSFTGPTFQFRTENPNAESKAAMVDQVSLIFPNQSLSRQSRKRWNKQLHRGLLFRQESDSRPLQRPSD